MFQMSLYLPPFLVHCTSSVLISKFKCFVPLGPEKKSRRLSTLLLDDLLDCLPVLIKKIVNMIQAVAKSLKHNPSLIPLVAMVGVGVGAAVFYPLRCALKSPDVSWDKKNNPEPWNEYTNKHYKFYVSEKGKDITGSPAPKY